MIGMRRGSRTLQAEESRAVGQVDRGLIIAAGDAKSFRRANPVAGAQIGTLLQDVAVEISQPRNRQRVRLRLAHQRGNEIGHQRAVDEVGEGVARRGADHGAIFRPARKAVPGVGCDTHGRGGAVGINTVAMRDASTGQRQACVHRAYAAQLN